MAIYETLFAPVSLHWRSLDAIEADLLAGLDADAGGAALRDVARIELLIREGDDGFRRRRYGLALSKYKEAQGKIYSFIAPRFNVAAYVGSMIEVALPFAPEIEEKLRLVGLGLVDAIRPRRQEPDRPILPGGVVEPLPRELKQFTGLGFQETRPLDGVVEDAAASGVALLLEDKPAVAVAVMEEALHQASAPGARVERSLLAALELNLASAHLQLGKTEQAMDLAKRSAEGFTRRQDPIGVAQALHLAGVAAQMAGDQETAAQRFSQAAEKLSAIDRGEIAVRPSIRDIELTQPTRPNLLARALGSIRAFRGAPRAALPVNRNLNTLDAVIGRNARTLTFRIPGRDEGWGTLPVSDARRNRQRARTWTVGVPAGTQNATFVIGDGRLPSLEEIERHLYRARIDALSFADLDITVADASTTSFYLNHLYAYVLPLKIGDCYHELGEFANAESNYLIAAGYSSLNRNIEATVLWLRLARNALEWGSTLYKAEKLAAARAQFEKIITQDGSVPASALYDTGSLQIPANEARTLIGQIDLRPPPKINPGIANIILEANAHLKKILAGLDYYGLLLSPIHTFEYLQQVARSFCQQAIQAEREFVNFKSREELESATRRELENAATMAAAEADGREQLLRAAQADATASQRAVDLANRRRTDAQDQRNQYAAVSSSQIWAQAASSAQLGGSDSWYNEISELADKLARGESISGERGMLAAAYTLWSGRKTRDYELDKMQDTINQLGDAIGVAQAQANASAARREAAEIAWQASVQQVAMAGEALDAFDNEFFTPDAWTRMAGIMRNISRSYLERAIRIAKLMERAYNFENDEAISVIKLDYGFGIANEAPGRDTRLLGGDALLVDVDSFTYQAITSTTRKTSRIKDVVSLASDYPAQFEAFLETGLLVFETDLYEFERLHPGSYEQRIEAVEIEVVGLLANQPLHGTLTAGGVTSFRRKDDTIGSRTHVIDTMALSDFQLRNDLFLYTADTGVRGLFQGLGLGGTWQLHLPRRSNAIDLSRMFDIRIVFYYKTKFDPALRATVLARPVRPGELRLQRTWSLRFDYPAAWYAFYKDGAARFTLNAERLPANQRNFQTDAVRFRVRTVTDVDPNGIKLRIVGPGGAEISAAADAGGVISTDNPALAPLVGIDPLGDWEVHVEGGPSLEDGAGVVDHSRVYNVQFSIDYNFDYLDEVL